MFVRSLFVTNSSSTSFVAYGMRLPTKYPMKNGYTMNGPIKGKTLDWEEYYEGLTGLDYSDSPVRFNVTNEDDHAVIYATKSQRKTTRHYGYKELTTEREDTWDGDILKVCELMGIECDRLPHWFIWSTGVDG